MLSNEEVKHIAKLARINLTEAEEKKFQKELGAILDYINKLNEVNTEGVEPLYQTTGLVDSFRSDEPRGEFMMSAEGGSASGGDLYEKLIGQAPQSQDRFIKVKSILKK